MKTFLEEVAQKIYNEHPKLDEVTLVFPNRRAILYFRKHLSAQLDRPVFSPKLVTIEDFIAGFSPLKVPDKLELIFQLYTVYNAVLRTSSPEGEESGGVEGVDQFYFWGDMLLMRKFSICDSFAYCRLVAAFGTRCPRS